MPRFDGTGPFGDGSLTGRGMGPCGRGVGFRRGRRFGRGFGRGMRYGYVYDCPVYPALSKEDEKAMLENELKAIEEDMVSIKKRIEELKE